MVELDRLIPPLVLDHLGDVERCYLTGVFNRYQGYPYPPAALVVDG